MTSANDRVVTLTFKFNEDHPPPGWKKGSKIPFETALNTLGNTMIKNVPVYAVAAVKFIYRDTVMNDSDLLKRLGFVLNGPVEEDKLYINISAPKNSADPVEVYSNHIVTKNGNPAPILQNVFITAIPPGGKLQLELTVIEGTAEMNGSHYTVVTGYSFYKTNADDGAYIFEVTLLKGFEDGAYVYKCAADVINGKVNPNRITAADMEELGVDWMD